MISKLSVEDKLFHFTIVKCLTPRSSNIKNIVKDEQFLMWAFKKRVPLNLPFIIPTYMGHFFTQVQSFYPFRMPLTTIFRKYRVPFSFEKEIAQNNLTTSINENILNLMRSRLVEGAWIKTDDAAR